MVIEMFKWFRITREAGPAKGNEKGTATQRSFCEQTAVMGGGSKPPSPALSRKTFALLLVAHCENLRVTR